MKVWAITDKQESTIGVFSTSNTKSGFFTKLTQNLKGRLKAKMCFIKKYYTDDDLWDDNTFDNLQLKLF